jgi:hypothetical protein
MKFSDVQMGMTVMFDHHDADNWAAFHEDLMRNPNYRGPENWFVSNYRKFEGIPLLVTQVKRSNVHGFEWNSLKVSSSVGSTSLSEHWFRPSDEAAFKELNKGVNEQIKTAPNPSARTKKNLTMGELKAMPGAVDYNAAAERFGKGRRTRRRRRTTRKH